MANARSRKREIDKAKREKAAVKRERRQGPAPEGEEGEATDVPTVARPSDDELLDALQVLHQRYDAEAIDFEEFETARAELLSRLQVD